jgi:hypothetical protein
VRVDRVIPGFLIALCLFASAAPAASITNRDDKDHTVTIVEGSTQKDHVLKPNAALRGICETGCLIRLGASRDDPFELTGSENTSIEEGELYDDEVDVPSDPAQGADVRPSQPTSRW